MVVTCVAEPITRLERHRDTMSIVARLAEGVVVVPASPAEPIAGLPNL